MKYNIPILPKHDIDYAYKMGYDCGVNGASDTNCYFSIFANPESTKSWEQGKKDADKSKGDNHAKD